LVLEGSKQHKKNKVFNTTETGIYLEENTPLNGRDWIRTKYIKSCFFGVSDINVKFFCFIQA